MAQSTNESLLFFAYPQSDIYFPIKNSQRVKYTSFHVCNSYVGFGSSSGGLYLFQKCQNASYNYLFTILNTDNSGPISCLSFATNDDHILAMATNRGNLTVVEIEPKKQLLYKCWWKTVYQSNEFTKNSINLLKWDPYYDYRLYISDESGQIFVLHNVKDMINLMVVPLPSLLLKISSKVFQLETEGDLMLLSTQYKYILYDMCDSSLTQIGKKPRSDGQYGVCFFGKHINDNHIYNCIFASRPKSRLWEVDLKGNVKFTHQFKELIINQSPVQVVNGQEICFSDQWSLNGKYATTPPTFSKLCVMNIIDFDTLLVTYSNSPNICLYIINPIKDCIVSYCVLNATHIQDMYCIENDIYLIYNISSDKRLRFSKISLSTREQCLKLLIENNDFISAAGFVINHISYFNEKIQTLNQFITSGMIEKIWSNLKDKERIEFPDIDNLINKINDKLSQNQSHSESEFLRENISPTDDCSVHSNSSNESELYNRVNNDLYYDIDSQLTDSGIDVLDLGLNELNRFKNIMLSKLNSVDFKSNLEPLHRDNEKLSHHSSNTSLENNQNYLQVNSPQDLVEREQQYDPKSVLDSLESELKDSHCVDECKCICGSPLPGSHLRQSEIQENIKTLIRTKNDWLKNSVIDLIEICQRNAIWPLYMDLILKCEEFNKYIDCSLMLNDIKYLQKHKIQQYLSSKQNFELLLNKFGQQRDNGNDSIVRCLECNKSLNNTIVDDIKWETILKLCIKCIGIEDSIILFKNIVLKNPKLSVELYLLILRMRMICVNQSPVTREKLNSLMNLLSSLRRDETESDNYSLSSTSSTVMSYNKNSLNGFKINLSLENCAKCNTNLISGNKSEKIVAFYCKHIYHKSCITHNYCDSCKT